MLDGLLGRGFSSKSKSLMKLTRSRLDVIQRKRNATQKFLKKDMADLLDNGLDTNAYGRAEGLLVELNMSDCYNIVDHLCEFLLKNMSMMQKQSECPEDCREAVASLMFAAARFSDLPELRDLRNLFQERYGNSPDYYVNQEFAEKLATKSSTMERKVKLMQDIASEFSIRWDSKGFEERISKPSVNVQNHPKEYEAIHVSNKDIRVKGEKMDFPVKGRLERAATDGKMVNRKNDYPKEYGAFHHNDYKCKSLNEAILPKGDEEYFSSKGRSEQVNDRQIYKQQKERHSFKRNELDHQSDVNLADNGQWALQEREVSLKKHDPEVSLQDRSASNTSRKEANDVKTVRSATASNGNELRHTNGRSNHLYERERTNAESELVDTLPQRKEREFSSLMEMRVKTEATDPLFAGDNDRGKHPIAQSPSMGKVKVEGADKSYYGSKLPPPYFKPKTRPKDNQNGVGVESTPAVLNNFGVAKVPSAPPSDNPDRRSKKIELQSLNPDDETGDAGIARLVNHGVEREYNEENMASYPVPKPRSMRRKHSKSRSSHYNVDSSEDAGTERRSSRSRRRDDSRQGLQILFDDERREKDEEEKVIDRLLIHYSKKPSTYEHGKPRRKPKSHNVHAVEGDVNRFPHKTGRDREDKGLEAVPRSASLPCEQTTATSEPTKVFARAASFQPDHSNAERHVHPKLPDYDDLAARFAALKGR